MIVNRAYKLRIYPNREQREILDKTFGCCRFIYNKMLEERKQVYQKLKEEKQALYNYTYKTEKNYKQLHDFLKEVDSKALQSEWRNLKSAYDNFFRNVKYLIYVHKIRCFNHVCQSISRPSLKFNMLLNHF